MVAAERTIGVVEDSPAMIDIATRIYQDELVNFRVVGSARSLSKALTLYVMTKPLLVSLDVELIGSQSGLQLANGLRVYNPDVHMVFLSYRADLVPAMHAAGARGFLDKAVGERGRDKGFLADVASVLNFAIGGPMPKSIKHKKYSVSVDEDFGFVSLVRN